ncbi:MAG TPA: S41 family peptidase [Clostridia bacterium]|nr:S41 family peptidase [Clostridia bacterium]
MVKRSIRSYFAILAIICLLFSQPVFAENSTVTEDTSVSSTQDDFINSVTTFVKEFYNGDVDDKTLIQGALKGMFSTMDPYTTFFTPEEADKFLGVLDDSFVGIGVTLEKKDNYIIITKAFPGSPAEKSGLCPGDKITSANGKSLIGLMPEEAATYIKGTEGTKVKLGIIKAGDTAVTELVVNRERVVMNPVTYDIRNGIGYIKLDSFSSNSAYSVNKALAVMDGKKITKIILDLRNNGGGYVDQAVSIANNFVPAGLVTKLDFKSPSMKDQTFYSYLLKQRYKLAVLVNENSASASEILSAAIQDTKAGTLVGTKTFGKAKVQNLIQILTPEAYKKYEEELGVKTINPDLLAAYDITPSKDEILGTIKMTTGMYTTPKGRMIDLKGLTPDIAVPDPKPTNGIDVNSIQKLRRVSKPDLGDSSPDVYNAEKILKLLGYKVDAPDSRLNDTTFIAIKKLQKDNHLHSYGVLDFATQSLLNKKLDQLFIKLDGQYAAAANVLK